MKQVFGPSSFLCALLLLFSSSCQQEENPAPPKGDVTFAFTQTTSDDKATPAFVVLGVTSINGNILENVKLPLSRFAQLFTSEPLRLPTGTYQLVQFTVLDKANTILYAAPIKGSDRASHVAAPLHIEFVINQNTTGQVVPQVLAVTPDDTPADFGYTNFGVAGQGSTAEVLIKTNVKIEIGGILYEDVDAQIRVSGYDVYNDLQWTKDFDFTGPADNVLAVRNGLHHYSIQLLDKWGIHDMQTEISLETIWEGRADGPLPTTFVLAGSKNVKKLSYYVTYREGNSTDGGTVYKHDTKVLYVYNASGQLAYIRYESFNAQTSRFEETRYDVVTYVGTVVSKITTYVDGKLHSESLYEYGIENKISLTMYYNNGLVWTQTSSANQGNNHLTVNYNLSDGNSFTYEFDILHKNIISDATSKYGQQCNQGNYQYDKNINPFRHLGFMDFNFQNWSAGNKVTEDVHYLACGFPTLIPVSHSYTYDRDGYPLKKITTYKTGSYDGGTTPVATRHLETDFFYQE